MRAALTPRRLLFAALGTLVVVLIFGSVRTTGALWAEQADGPDTTITTGSLGLAPGAGSGTYTFPGLEGVDMVAGADGAQQAVLNITNTGTTPLRFRLASAGPNVSTSGATVVVQLSGTPAAACPALSTPLTGAFTAQNTSSATTGFTGSWHPLAVGATTPWCIRVTLVSVTGTQPATFTITFDFAAEQTRP